MPKMTTITHPPRVNLDDALAVFPPQVRHVLRYWHTGLRDYYDGGGDVGGIAEDLFDTWSQIAGVSFFDTMETYTQELDGVPVTENMMAEAVDKLNAVRSPHTCETILNREPITLLGMEPHHERAHDPKTPTAGGADQLGDAASGERRTARDRDGEPHGGTAEHGGPATGRDDA